MDYIYIQKIHFKCISFSLSKHCLAFNFLRCTHDKISIQFVNQILAILNQKEHFINTRLDEMQQMWNFRGIYLSWIFMEIYLKHKSCGAYGSPHCTNFYDTCNIKFAWVLYLQYGCKYYAISIHHNFNEVNKQWLGMLSLSGWAVIFHLSILNIVFPTCNQLRWHRLKMDMIHNRWQVLKKENSDYGINERHEFQFCSCRSVNTL